PVGACVGMKGTRVQSIIRELRGEKIDIVEWSDDPVVLVTNAISPARVQRVTVIDEAEKVMEVLVEDRQLSLAIGKKGQNVRLAAKLTGWKIDIKSEEEKRREVEAQFEGFDAERAQADLAASLLSLQGFNEGMWQTLQDSSLNTAEHLIHLATQELEQILSISDELAKAIQKVALDTVSARRPAEALDALFSSGPDQVETPVDGGETPASASSSGDTISETPEAATSEVAADQADMKSENVVDPITADTSTGEIVEKQEPSK
ncbi:MAG: transcription termination/antitermination protein NusA, partial [Acidobacteriota bacterium]|nr:transcription termination/antitermination protein NusA [Acidobacteriota bacterium]